MERQPDASAIADVAFDHHAFPALGVESVALSALLDRTPAACFERPHRLAFHHLMLVTGGEGTHEIDLVRHVCRPGTVLHVRPGQVQHYSPTGGFEAEIVLFRADVMLPGTAADDLPRAAVTVPGACADRVQAGFAALAAQYRATDGSPVAGRILQHQVHALLLQVGQLAPTLQPADAVIPHRALYRRFVDALEVDFATTRRVEDYARTLGCTAKTLGRACLAAGGSTPKDLIERRVALEAKRLLAHTGLPVVEIGLAVGFSEATNFAKFFRRREGVSPAVFRGATRRTRPD